MQSKGEIKFGVPVERRVFLTVAESGEFTGVPLAFLRRLIGEGTLKAFKEGKMWRIPGTALEDLAHQLTTVAVAKEEMSEGEKRDLAMNKLRRQGLLTTADKAAEVQ